eukprot:scaffold75957_cov28-Tisochrysis_lutea.AAC.3
MAPHKPYRNAIPSLARPQLDLALRRSWTSLTTCRSSHRTSNRASCCRRAQCSCFQSKWHRRARPAAPIDDRRCCVVSLAAPHGGR